VEEEEETAMVAEGGRGQYTDIIAPDIAQQHLYMYLRWKRTTDLVAEGLIE
jgi:hypothetical protein